MDEKLSIAELRHFGLRAMFGFVTATAIGMWLVSTPTGKLVGILVAACWLLGNVTWYYARRLDPDQPNHRLP